MSNSGVFGGKRLRLAYRPVLNRKGEDFGGVHGYKPGRSPSFATNDRICAATSLALASSDR